MKLDTEAIEDCLSNMCGDKFIQAQNISPTIDKSRKQLSALVANQIAGRCKDCAFYVSPIGTIYECVERFTEKHTFYFPNKDDYCSLFTDKDKK